MLQLYLLLLLKKLIKYNSCSSPYFPPVHFLFLLVYLTDMESSSFNHWNTAYSWCMLQENFPVYKNLSDLDHYYSHLAPSVSYKTSIGIILEIQNLRLHPGTESAFNRFPWWFYSHYILSSANLEHLEHGD